MRSINPCIILYTALLWSFNNLSKRFVFAFRCTLKAIAAHITMKTINGSIVFQIFTNLLISCPNS